RGQRGRPDARRAAEEDRRADRRARFFGTWAAALPLKEKRMLVQPDHAQLSIRRQCALLSLTRSMHYYVPVEVSAEDIALMKEIDRLYTQWPFYGSRKIRVELEAAGHEVNRKRVQRLM